MDRDRLGTLFEASMLIAFVIGFALIALGGPIKGAIGALALIFGLLSLMPVLRFTVLAES